MDVRHQGDSYTGGRFEDSSGTTATHASDTQSGRKLTGEVVELDVQKFELGKIPKGGGHSPYKVTKTKIQSAQGLEIANGIW
ncbi:hypothetical protein TorRG33x02_351480 [Trema orientale]|uniref:Uncharacterized protein n=1 Tax=Trema orientale TaxID=63057 RepID=A0A2P5AFP5_TREOI|nr:hypothetical protein TorRG33x02_351480 [Trema orientale]